MGILKAKTLVACTYIIGIIIASIHFNNPKILWALALLILF